VDKLRFWGSRTRCNDAPDLVPAADLWRGNFRKSAIWGSSHDGQHRWAADPNRRSDIAMDQSKKESAPEEEANITGFAGSAGVASGYVRLLDDPDQGSLLKSGEILVAASTNIGWTPLFPRAAAVVTDVGEPLSHAAIVARELGIPAVVGTGDATMRLQTGDRVHVDGGRGIVTILKR